LGFCVIVAMNSKKGQHLLIQTSQSGTENDAQP